MIIGIIMTSKKKDKVIYIRCSNKTFRRWRMFVAKYGLEDYEKALNLLLDNFGIEFI